MASPHPEWVYLQPQASARALGCGACGLPLSSAEGDRIFCACEGAWNCLLLPEAVGACETLASLTPIQARLARTHKPHPADRARALDLMRDLARFGVNAEVRAAQFSVGSRAGAPALALRARGGRVEEMVPAVRDPVPSGNRWKEV